MSELSTQDCRWWSKDNERERARRISDIAAQLWVQQRPQREDHKRAMRLYGNYPYVGLGPRLWNKQNRMQGRALSFNVTKAVIDTYVSQLTKDKIATTVQAIGVDWSTQQKCRALESFISGINYESHVYETATQCALDSAVFGTGLLKPYIDLDGECPRIAVDRTLPWDLLMDPLESMHGDPQTVFQIQWRDKYALREDYPEMKGKLIGSNVGNFDDGAVADQGQTIDLVPVVEAWHLARGKTPGRHSIAVGDVLLSDEEYKRTMLPFVPIVRQRPILGYFGDSLSLELEAIQTQINILLDKIRRSHHLLSAGYWLIEQGSDVISNQLTNQIGHILRYKGTMPQLVAPNTVAVEIYQHLDRLCNKAFELTGVNQMMAQSKQPGGDYSGRAKLVDVDIQSQRFKPSYELFQGAFMRLSRHYIALGRDIHESYGDWSLPAQTKRNVFESVSWADASLDDSEFTVRLKPTNALADDPSGLLETATELLQAGMIDPAGAQRVLTQHEDFETLLSSTNASYDLTMMMGERMLDKGEWMAPEPEMNLPESIKEMQMLKLQSVIKGAPQDRIDLLDRWLVRAVELDHEKTPPPAPSAPPPPVGGTPGPATPMAQ